MARGESMSWDPNEPIIVQQYADGTLIGGVWVAYHPDWSGFALFAEELLALRHAVSNHMLIGFARFGEALGGNSCPLTGDELRAQIDEEREAILRRLSETWRQSMASTSNADEP